MYTSQSCYWSTRRYQIRCILSFFSGQAKLFDLDNAKKVTRQAHQSHTYYDDEVYDVDDCTSTLAHFTGIEDPADLEHVLQCHQTYQEG